MQSEVKPARWRWLHRHWPWAVAIWGSLQIAGVICLFVFGVMAAMGNSDAAKLALSTARSSTYLTSEIGTLVEPGLFIFGNINVTPTEGQADLRIPISGPHGSGTLYCVSHKAAGVWALDLLQFATSDEAPRLDLLPRKTNPAAPVDGTVEQ
jgi:hypothetical protein